MLAIALACYSLYWVVGIVQPLVYRVSFLLAVLVLTFLVYPATSSARDRARVSWADWLLAGLAMAALLWPLLTFDDFIYHAADPSVADMAFGAILIVLVLEATRRTAGWILPFTAVCFLVYTFYGPLLELIGLGMVAHRGYDVARIVGTTYMTLEGIFGVPLEVASTYIILFSIYGAMLAASGAGRFFLEWSMAAVGRSGGGAGPGRAVTVAGLLLGTVSGSGVANTVTLGSVAWPMLKRAGYAPAMGGAILSAAGIGAIICPPALGAAAFIIAEFLHITYLQVIVMAAIPALLYFFSIFLMIEADTRRAGARPVPIDTPSALGADETARLPLPRRHRHPDHAGPGDVGVPRGVLLDDRRGGVELRRSRRGAHAATPARGAARRRAQRAAGGRRHRHGRHHRRHGDAHGAGPEDLRPHRRSGGRRTCS